MELQLISQILDNFEKQLRASGIKSLINWAWLMIKSGSQPLAWTKNFRHYDSYPIETDKERLRTLRRYTELSMRLLPVRTRAFYDAQSFSPIQLIMAYTKDRYAASPRHICSGAKKNKLLRCSQNVILDHADESNFSKPAYYVTQAGQELTVIVRGTANKSDKMVDIDFTPCRYEAFGEVYYLHSGFYWHAQTIFQELESKQLLDQRFSYVTTGHSMGGAVSCILGFLLYVHFQQEWHIPNPPVRTYGFGMACAGCIRFAEFCRRFAICVVNGFDMVPATSFHAMKVQQQRLLYENNRRNNGLSYRQRRQDVLALLQQGETKIQNARQGEKINLGQIQLFETLGENPTTKEISESCTQLDDLFPAGEILHYIRGCFYRVSVHDISEITISYPSFLDHFGYQQAADDIGHMLGEL